MRKEQLDRSARHHLQDDVIMASLSGDGRTTDFPGGGRQTSWSGASPSRVVLVAQLMVGAGLRRVFVSKDYLQGFTTDGASLCMSFHVTLIRTFSGHLLRLAPWRARVIHRGRGMGGEGNRLFF